jgi:hypothetical protein
MFLTTVLFLLLPFSILAKSIPRAEHHDKRTGCLPHFSGGLFHKTLFFHDPDLHQPFRYAISTRHTNYYPDILRMAMRLSGFWEVWPDKQEECGWHKVKSGSSSFGPGFTVHSGDVYWKYDDLRWVSEPKKSNVPSYWVANYASHIPPATMGPKPDQSTLDIMVGILQNNKPAGDVYEVATIVLGFWLMLTGYTVVFGLLGACMECSARRRKNAEGSADDDGIELDAIKAPDDDAPKYSYEDRNRALASSTDTLRSEPLPIYSLDGAGR